MTYELNLTYGCIQVLATTILNLLIHDIMHDGARKQKGNLKVLHHACLLQKEVFTYPQHEKTLFIAQAVI